MKKSIFLLAGLAALSMGCNRGAESSTMDSARIADSIARVEREEAARLDSLDKIAQAAAKDSIFRAQTDRMYANPISVTIKDKSNTPGMTFEASYLHMEVELKNNTDTYINEDDYEVLYTLEYETGSEDGCENAFATKNVDYTPGLMSGGKNNIMISDIGFDLHKPRVKFKLTKEEFEQRRRDESLEL